MDCLDPSLRLNCYHGDPGKKNDLIVYYMAISEKQRTVNIDNPTASAAPQHTELPKKRESRQSDDPVPSVIDNAFQLDWIHKNVWMHQYKHTWSFLM